MFFAQRDVGGERKCGKSLVFTMVVVLSGYLLQTRVAPFSTVLVNFGSDCLILLDGTSYGLVYGLAWQWGRFVIIVLIIVLTRLQVLS